MRRAFTFAGSPVLAVLLAAAGMAASASPIAGLVTDTEGHPVEGASVTACGRTTETNELGRFRLEVDLPCKLRVLHPAYETSRRRVESVPEAPMVLALVRRQVRRETVVVTASRRKQKLGQTTGAITVADPERATTPPSSPAELLATAPSVATNGQGGRFQTVSIRGIGKQRIYTLLEGMRIVTDRRAGVSSSFLDPLLLDRAEVVRGPASTIYGSGALGGVIQLLTASTEGLVATAGLKDEGLERLLGATYGSDRFSCGLALRASDDTEDAEGHRLNDHYQQASGFFQGTIPAAGRKISVTLIPAVARDIGKSNSRIPRKRTSYPAEDHLFLKIGVEGDSYEGFLYAHPNRLTTESRESGSPTVTVRNRATDIGASFLRHILFGGGNRLDFGFDYFGRRAVDASESSGAGADPVETLRNGVEDEVAAFLATDIRLASATFQCGMRATGFRQKASGREERRRGSLDGFVSVGWPIWKGLSLMANVATGTRNPLLSERFFSGTTGRGTVVGNPELLPERALNVEVGLRAAGGRYVAEAFVFHDRIQNYIEKVETGTDHFTFQNVETGSIAGIDLQLLLRPITSLDLQLAGHLMKGTIDSTGDPLSDIPPARVALSVSKRFDWLSVDASLRHDFPFRHPGSGETARDAADWLEASVHRDLSNGLTARLYAKNLLDQAERTSPDDRAPLPTGRSFGVVLSFRMP